VSRPPSFTRALLRFATLALYLLTIIFSQPSVKATHLGCVHSISDWEVFIRTRQTVRERIILMRLILVVGLFTLATLISIVCPRWKA
jgi:hypothetical protein